MSVEDVLNRRCNKAIAIILRHKDEHLDEFLPEEVSERFRTLVLDQINDLHDLFNDLMRVTRDEGRVLNEHYLDMIEKVHEAVTTPTEE